MPADRHVASRNQSGNPLVRVSARRYEPYPAADLDYGLMKDELQMQRGHPESEWCRKDSEITVGLGLD